MSERRSGPRRGARVFILLPALVAVLSCGEPASAPSPPLDGTWRLVSLQVAGQAAVPIASPDAFTVGFEGNGRLAVRADCNQCGGSWALSGGRLEIADEIVCTRAFCGATAPLDTRFVEVLAAAERFSIDGGELVLSGPGGTLKLRR